MAHKRIEQDFIITPEKVEKNENRPVIGKTSNVSDQIVDECQSNEDIYMIQRMSSNSHTAKRAVKRGSVFSLISDDGETVIEKPKMRSISLVLQNYRNKDVYVGVKGTRMKFIDGKGNILHNRNTSFREAKYMGGGKFMIGNKIEERDKNLGNKDVNLLELKI